MIEVMEVVRLRKAGAKDKVCTNRKGVDPGNVGRNFGVIQ